jgi:hypothetical protein
MLLKTPDGVNAAAVLTGALDGALRAAQTRPSAQTEEARRELWDTVDDVQAFVAERLAVAFGESSG